MKVISPVIYATFLITELEDKIAQQNSRNDLHLRKYSTLAGSEL